MNDTPTPLPPQRGALLATISATKPVMAARSSFSIAVSINNPFDVPVTIQKVSTLLPVDLYDVNQLTLLRESIAAQREIEDTRAELLGELGVRAAPRATPGGAVANITRWSLGIRPLFNFLLGFVDLSAIFDRAAVAVSPGEESVPGVEQQIAELSAQLLSQAKEVSVSGLSEQDIRRKVDEMVRPLEKAYTDRLAAEQNPVVILQPGDTVTQLFHMRTVKNLTFSPASFNLSVTIQYRLDKVDHNQSMPYTLDIQAATVDIIGGAVVGAAAGVLARSAQQSGSLTTPANGWFSLLPQALYAALLSIFAVIAFVRKAGVQPIVSVQDVWGGLLTGFLVGYTGVEALGGIFGEAGGGQGVLPTTTP